LRTGKKKKKKWKQCSRGALTAKERIKEGVKEREEGERKHCYAAARGKKENFLIYGHFGESF